MAVHKAIRSNPPAQPKPHHAKTARAGDPEPKRPSPDHQLKAELFEALRHLNRGYGVALAAFDRLEAKDRRHTPHLFTAGLLHDYRNRTQALRTQANRDLLRLLAGREEHEAEHFGALTEKRKPKRPRS